MRRNPVWALTERDRAREKALIFMHIPKTGGRTLAAIIARQFVPRQVLWLDLDEVYESVLDFKARPEEVRGAVRFMRGHVWYGAHQLLPGEATYITLLREPIARTVSLYNHARDYRNPARPELWTASDFHAFMEQAAWGVYLDNAQTRFVAGDMSTPVGACTEDMLAQAKQNIEARFSLVGLAERYDETVLLLSDLFAWRFPYSARLNVSRTYQRVEDVAPATMELVRRCNWLDIQLYEYVQERFESLVKDQPASFGGRLRRYRTANAAYGKLLRARRSLIRQRAS